MNLIDATNHLVFYKNALDSALKKYMFYHNLQPSKLTKMMMSAECDALRYQMNLKPDSKNVILKAANQSSMLQKFLSSLKQKRSLTTALETVLADGGNNGLGNLYQTIQTYQQKCVQTPVSENATAKTGLTEIMQAIEKYGAAV